MADHPPEEVAIELLRQLDAVLNDFEHTDDLVPVLRGSLLLRHWFGSAARPAGDIDLECFAFRNVEDVPEEQRQYMREGFGEWGEYESPVDFAKAMCRYAAESTSYHRWDSNRPTPAIEFQRDDSVNDDENLWVYGTPGQRFITGWTWRQLGKTSQGRLQIDIAQSGRYQLDDIETERIVLHPFAAGPFEMLGYSQEMMLAAKLSWIIRSFTPHEDGTGRLQWSGEPKDLFDAHLLLTQGTLDSQRFQRAFLAVGLEDELNWNDLELVLSAGSALNDSDFLGWNTFREQQGSLVNLTARRTMDEIGRHLPQVLGSFHCPGEIEFLRTINSGAVDEFDYLTYADFLEEKGDQRASFLRLYASVFFHASGMDAEQEKLTRTALLHALRAAPEGWLLRLFGTTTRFRNVQSHIENRTL